MNSQIQFVNMKNDDQQEAIILKKLEKLQHKYEWIINARVFIKEEQAKDATKNKVCEIDLSVPGPNIFSKTHAENIEAAIAGGFDDVEVLLRKHKDKMYKSIR